MDDLGNKGETDRLGMPNPAQTAQQSRAEHEFERAHRAAFVQDILAPLRNQPADLLPFQQVREKLRLTSQTYQGLQDVPLSQIVGSVARYHDFSRAFRPRRKSLRERWQRVMKLESSLPPIELYKVGEIYFVVDGNHRVSVARQSNASTIRAHVWEYKTRVPVESNDNLNDILIRQEYLEFLEQSHLDVSRPNQRIVFTVPSGYRRLGETIAQHREWLDRQHVYTVSFEEAAVDWYDSVYIPMVRVIRDRKVLLEFPGRTEADLVAYILRYREELEQEWSDFAPTPASSLVDTNAASVAPESAEARLRSRQAAQEFVEKARQSGWRRLVAWFKRKILKWEILDRHPKQDPE